MLIDGLESVRSAIEPGSEQPHLRVHARLLAELFFGDIGPRPGERVQTVHGQFAVVVVQRREHPRQRHHGVGERPAERAGMHGLRQHVDADGDRGRAPDAGADRRRTSAGVATVGHDRDVGAEQVGVAHDQIGQMLGGALLLALDDDLDRHRRRAICQQRADRRGVDRDPALVVGGAAAVHSPVSHDGLERRRLPQRPGRPRAGRRGGRTAARSALPAALRSARTRRADHRRDRGSGRRGGPRRPASAPSTRRSPARARGRSRHSRPRGSRRAGRARP